MGMGVEPFVAAFALVAATEHAGVSVVAGHGRRGAVGAFDEHAHGEAK